MPQSLIMNRDAATEAGTQAGCAASVSRLGDCRQLCQGRGQQCMLIQIRVPVHGDVISEAMPVHPDRDSLFNQQKCKDEAVLTSV